MEQRSRDTVAHRRPSAVGSLGSVLTVATLGLLTLTGCGHHAAAPVPSGSSQPSASTSVLAAPAMKVVYRSVSGRLPSAARRQLTRQMTTIVSRWWDAAYLTDRSPKSFPVFTPAAAHLAEQRPGLMTSDLPRGTTISVVRRQIGLDVLAVKKRPVGVDVVADLAYTAGGVGTYRVHGTVSMIPTSKGWRVFAFDVTKSRAGKAGGAR